MFGLIEEQKRLGLRRRGRRRRCLGLRRRVRRQAGGDGGAGESCTQEKLSPWKRFIGHRNLPWLHDSSALRASYWNHNKLGRRLRKWARSQRGELVTEKFRIAFAYQPLRHVGAVPRCSIAFEGGSNGHANRYQKAGFQQRSLQTRS